jgi:hypothetical protein
MWVRFLSIRQSIHFVSFYFPIMSVKTHVDDRYFKEFYENVWQDLKFGFTAKYSTIFILVF